MKKIIPLVFLLAYLFIGCSSSNPSNPSSNNYLQEDYLITIAGELNDLSTEKIDAEYDVFFFTSTEDRKIYLGGKIPSGENYNITWLECLSSECSGLGWNDYKYFGPIFSDKITSSGYYGTEIKNMYIPSQSTEQDYSVVAKVGNEDFINGNYIYTAKGTKNLTFKVGPLTARDFTLDVYQQQSYNSMSFTEERIKLAFEKMHVSTTVNLKSSDLTNQVVNWDRDPQTTFDSNPIIIYAYNKVYPDIENTLLAMSTYSYEYPNNGLLFYVENYNIVNGPVDNSIEGVTLQSWINGQYKQPVLSYVFVKKITDNWSTNYKNTCITATSIHEIAHLWCAEFTDEATHEKWHNGDNKSQCVMISPYERNQSGNPINETINIFDYLGFCEGHLQRGMNISWELKQYTPYGENSSKPSKDLFTSINENAHLNNDIFEVNIESSKNDYVKGELVDVLVRVKNNSTDTIKLGAADHHLYSYEESRTIDNKNSNYKYSYVLIPPHQDYVYLVNPLNFIAHNKESIFPGFPWYYWDEGNYDYYISYDLYNTTYISNKIPIKINSVPDSLKQAFEDLKEDLKNPATLNKYETLFEKYKGSFYDKEFFYKLLKTNSFYYAIANEEKDRNLRPKAMDLYKEFIIKYPNCEAAYNLFHRIYDYKNKGNEFLLEEIINLLKKKEPESIILKVLKSQQNYWTKDLKKYGF